MMTKAPLKPQPKPSTWALTLIYRLVSLAFLYSLGLGAVFITLGLTGKAEVDESFSLFMASCAFAFYYIILYNFWKILRNASQGKIFDHSNVIGFRRIAFCLLIAGLWRYVISQIVSFGSNGDSAPDVKLTINGSFSLNPESFLNELSLALFAFALAEIFRQGYLVRQEELRLRAEQELTV